MQAHIRALVKRFGTAAKLAAIVGVTQDTVWSWTTGRRQPTGTARRTLEVLFALAVDAPLLLDTLTGPKQRELPALDLIARSPAVQPVKPVDERAYWLDLWNDPCHNEMDYLSDDEFERVKRLIGK